MKEQLNDWHNLCGLVRVILYENNLEEDKIKYVDNYSIKVREYFNKYKTHFTTATKP